VASSGSEDFGYLRDAEEGHLFGASLGGDLRANLLYEFDAWAVEPSGDSTIDEGPPVFAALGLICDPRSDGGMVRCLDAVRLDCGSPGQGEADVGIVRGDVRLRQDILGGSRLTGGQRADVGALERACR